jgi:hypothetical protein
MSRERYALAVLCKQGVVGSSPIVSTIVSTAASLCDVSISQHGAQPVGCNAEPGPASAAMVVAFLARASAGQSRTRSVAMPG